MQPILYSRRLILRPFTLADVSEVRRMAGDARIADTTMAIPHPYPEGAAEAWISTHAASYEATKEITYAVVTKDGENIVGAATLLDISKLHARAELGYWTGYEHWSKGYCTEAVIRLIEFAHQELKTTRIVARCLVHNVASSRVMEKAGLSREGHLIQHVNKNGRYEDMLLYGLVLQGRNTARTYPALQAIS